MRRVDGAGYEWLRAVKAKFYSQRIFRQYDEDLGNGGAPTLDMVEAKQRRGERF